MKSFQIPVNLNGAELVDELTSAGVKLAEDIGAYKDLSAPKIFDGLLWLDIADADENKAKAIVAKHNGTTVAPEPTVADKLASVGLNLDDLKTALGL